MFCFFILDIRLHRGSYGAGVVCDEGQPVQGAPAQPRGPGLRERILYSYGLYAFSLPIHELLLNLSI